MKITPILGINGYKSKDGRFPLYVRVNIGQKRTLVPVGAKIKKGEWDSKSGRVKVDQHPNAASINLKILELCNSIEKNHLKGKEVQVGDTENFYWWFDERLKYTKQKHSVYNYEKLKAVKAKLEAFAPILPVSRLDYKFLLDYERHLISIGNKANTIADNMMRIRIIVNMIIASRKNPDFVSPFLHYVSTTTKPKKNRVTMDTIQLMESMDLGIDKDKQLAIDMYLFSFYNAGIRFGDLCRLRNSDVSAGRLRYTMHKTTIERNIKQVPQALRIIDKYKRENGFLFQTGVEWRKSESKSEIDREDKHINARNSYFNKKLKDACRDDLFIPEVTFHTSRHSFADYTKQKKFGNKFDVHTLKDLLGHKKVSTTEMYMQEFYEEESDLAMDQLFGSNKEDLPKLPKKGAKAKKKSD